MNQCPIPKFLAETRETRTSEAVTIFLMDFDFVFSWPKEAAEGRQSVTLGFERLIPEALFRPQDFGIPSAGVTGTERGGGGVARLDKGKKHA